jgi:glycine cleavage system aminomethyltransferase T
VPRAGKRRKAAGGFLGSDFILKQIKDKSFRKRRVGFSVTVRTLMGRCPWHRAVVNLPSPVALLPRSASCDPQGAPAREGIKVFAPASAGGAEAGVITSGTFSPWCVVAACRRRRELARWRSGGGVSCCVGAVRVAGRAQRWEAALG